MSVRAQGVLLLEAFSSKEDPDRTASEHDNGPLPHALPPFVTTANPTERARETYAYAEEIDVSVSELREWGCGLRVCGELFFVKWNWIRFAAFPMCPRKIPPPRELRLPLDNRAS